jgi:uncharacterized protein (UPF0548 family)
VASKLYPDRGSSDAKLLRDWAGRAPSFDPVRSRGRGFQADRHLIQLGFESAGAPVEGGLFERAGRQLLNYEVFPHELLEATCQWRLESRPVEVGDIILQRIHVLTRKGQPRYDLIGGVRVDRLLRDDWERGLRYLTLRGHPERGMATLLVRKDPGTGQVSFMIETVSAPGRWFTWAARPWARQFQIQAQRRALEHFRHRLAAVPR